MCSFPYLEPVCFSMSSSNCCFLTSIRISQEAGQVAWYSHLFQNFHSLLWSTVKGFGIVNKTEVDVFLELSCCFCDPTAIWSLVPLPFLLSFLSPTNVTGCQGSYLVMRCNKRHSVGREEPEWSPQMVCSRHQTQAVLCSKFFTIYLLMLHLMPKKDVTAVISPSFSN